MMSPELETIVLGGGCFWCLDAVFSHIKGVQSVIVGYAGGDHPDPTYDVVSGGDTGHAETVLVTFDPLIINLRKILEIFFVIHNPTTLNRQGSDVGSQYRSIILYKNNEELRQAKEIIKELADEGAYNDPIVTEIKPLEKFYRAEEEHQKYFEKNPEKAYCQLVIAPKVKKIRETFEEYYK